MTGERRICLKSGNFSQKKHFFFSPAWARGPLPGAGQPPASTAASLLSCDGTATCPAPLLHISSLHPRGWPSALKVFGQRQPWDGSPGPWPQNRLRAMPVLSSPAGVWRRCWRGSQPDQLACSLPRAGTGSAASPGSSAFGHFVVASQKYENKPVCKEADWKYYGKLYVTVFLWHVTILELRIVKLFYIFFYFLDTLPR